MDDRELMDKIRKSMEGTPVPESLKPENIQKMLEEQSENQQPNEAARTEKDDQPKDTTTHRFWNARTSRYIGAAAAGSRCNCGTWDYSGAAQDAYQGKARRHNIHSK